MSTDDEEFDIFEGLEEAPPIVLGVDVAQGPDVTVRLTADTTKATEKLRTLAEAMLEAGLTADTLRDSLKVGFDPTTGGAVSSATGNIPFGPTSREEVQDILTKHSPKFATGGVVPTKLSDGEMVGSKGLLDFASQFLTSFTPSNGVKSHKYADPEVYIVAPTTEQARNYLRDWHPQSYTIVTSPHVLRGKRPPGILLCYGQYWTRSDFEEIKHLAAMIGLKFVVEKDPHQL